MQEDTNPAVVNTDNVLPYKFYTFFCRDALRLIFDIWRPRLRNQKWITVCNSLKPKQEMSHSSWKYAEA